MIKTAALQMYDFPHLRPHTDNLWQGIWAAFNKIGYETENALNRSIGASELWSSPKLGFAQTCGLPYVRSLRGHVTLIGTPDYGIIPDQPGWYNSVIIARKTDIRAKLADFSGAKFAYNGGNSQSGLYAIMFELQAEFGSAPFFGSCQISGGHALSARAVAQGRADIAAIDAVTWRYLQQSAPEICQLKVLQTTSPCPGLPYIAARNSSSQALTNAVETAITNLPSAAKKSLGLKALWRSIPEHYNIIAQRAAQSSAVITAHNITIA